MYTVITFEVKLTEDSVKESAGTVQLNVTRSGQFSEIYTPSIVYTFSETGSSIALGINFFNLSQCIMKQHYVMLFLL